MGWSDVVHWMNVDRGDLIVAIFTLIVAISVGAMTRSYVKAAEKQAKATEKQAKATEEQAKATEEQAKAALVTATAAEESVKVAKAAANASMFTAYDQAKAAEESARENADAVSLQLAALREQRQPYVYVDIRGDDQRPGFLIVLIQNVGSTVATDVVVAFDPPLQSSQSGRLSNKSTLSVAAVPPGRMITYDLDTNSAYFAAGYPLVYKVRISAKGHQQPIPQLSYSISLENLKDMSAVNSGSLKDIAEAIQRVESLLSNLPTAIRTSGGTGRGYHDDDESMHSVTE
jgi:hypothetical protein